MKGILQNLYTLQRLDAAPQTATATQVASLRAGIPSGMLAHYDRVRARGKKGIALVRNHVCTNCRMQVPVAVTAALKAGLIQVCGNCGIYLCLPDSEEQEVKPAAVAEPKAARQKRKRVAAGSV